VKEADRRVGPYPYYGASGIVDHVDGFLFDGEYLLIAEDGENLRTRSTPIAFLARGKFWVNNHAHIVRGNDAADTRFLMYSLAATDISGYLTGSTMPKLTQGNMNRIPLRTPSLPEQRAIAHILSTLDEKIELNRRMSETLEAMARALFKSWFVDFDPVRAKAEDRDPGLPQPLADLFPDSFEDSELGEIPRGWEVGVLGDVLVQRVDRCSPSDETRSRPYVPIECIAANSLLLAESKPGEEAQSSLTRFREGDLLFGAMRPYFHKVAIAPFDGTTRTTVLVLRPRQADDFSFAALLIHDDKTIEYATNHSTGSTIPYAVWQGSLETMPIVLPPAVLRKAFDETVRSLLNRIPPVFFANRTLAALRDALLPRLISGELRVRDAEKFVAEVA
jgi:type I restriction enzyme S subunit